MLEEDDLVRSQRKVLSELGKETSVGQLLEVVFQRGAWRIVEVFSQEGRPFELELRWSAAKSSGAWVKLTTSHALRVSVFAKSLTLKASNLSSEPNTVTGRVDDGFSQTANVWEHRARTDGTTPLSIPIPPFAAAFRLDLADREALARATITLLDGQGTARARYSAATQPAGGVALGGAGRLEIATEDSIDLRGIFTLSL